MNGVPNFVALLPIVAIVTVFSFTAVVTWVKAQGKEREAYYKSETLKKIAEAPGPSATAALDYLREQEKIAQRHRRGEQTLGGLITLAAGVGLMIFLQAIEHKEPVYLAGLIPTLVGAALLAYASFLAPKE